MSATPLCGGRWRIAVVVAVTALPLAAAEAQRRTAGSGFLTSVVSRDTVAIASFTALSGVGTTRLVLTLDHLLHGKLAASHYRVSRHADFRDATWIAYPTAGKISWDANGQGSAPCAWDGPLRVPTHFRFPVHLQVRAPSPGASRGFIASNVAGDTLCLSPF